jgi:hypothetical protein
MSRRERDKGVHGEREVAELWRRHGAAVRGLEATGDHLVITPGQYGPTLHSEVKRQETARPWLWFEQASSEAPPGTLAIVHMRRNRSPWLALVDAEELAELLCELASLRWIARARAKAEG